jgi:zinc transport system ATP-binding protein
MYERIEKLNKEGVAIIMVSHDIAAAVRYADYILHMGERIFYTTKEKYMESEEGSFFIRMQNKEEQDNV